MQICARSHAIWVELYVMFEVDGNLLPSHRRLMSTSEPTSARKTEKKIIDNGRISNPRSNFHYHFIHKFFKPIHACHTLERETKSKWDSDALCFGFLCFVFLLDATQVKLLIDVSTIVWRWRGKNSIGFIVGLLFSFVFVPWLRLYQLSRDCAGSIVMKSHGKGSSIHVGEVIARGEEIESESFFSSRLVGWIMRCLMDWRRWKGDWVWRAKMKKASGSERKLWWGRLHVCRSV